MKVLTKEKLFETAGCPKRVSAIESIDKFIIWRTNHIDDLQYFKQLARDGVLNRKELSEGIQEEQNTSFPRSTLHESNGNKWIVLLLQNLEDYLRYIDVLPQITAQAEEAFKKGSKNTPKTHNSSKQKASRDAKRIQTLEEENIQLKARLSKLENENTVKQNIYADLATMGADFGI